MNYLRLHFHRLTSVNLFRFGAFASVNMLALSSVSAQDHDDLFTIELPVSDAAPLLDTYLKSALNNNAGLRAAFDEWQAALEDIPQVTALPNPTLQWTHFVEEIQTRTGPQNNRFVLSQAIPWKGKRSLAGKMAADRAEGLWWAAAGLKLDVIRDVKQVYYEYAYLAQAIRIVKENIALLYNLEPVVQARVRGGASQGDLLRLQVEIGKLENESETLERLRPALNEQLNAIMNDPTSESKPWPTIAPPEGRVFRRADLKVILDKMNPELRRMEWRRKQTDHLISRRKLENRPDFTVGLTYIETGSATTAIKPSDSGDDPFGITVGVSIPIWRKKTDAGVRQSRSHESAMHRSITQKRYTLHAQLELQIYQLDDAARQIALYQDSLIPRAQQAMEITQVEYQSDNAALLDVIDSERELLSFEKSYWRAVSDYGKRLAELEALCGGDLS